jgi:hypothetical protein
MRFKPGADDARRSAVVGSVGQYRARAARTTVGRGLRTGGCRLRSRRQRPKPSGRIGLRYGVAIVVRRSVAARRGAFAAHVCGGYKACWGHFRGHLSRRFSFNKLETERYEVNSIVLRPPFSLPSTVCPVRPPPPGHRRGTTAKGRSHAFANLPVSASRYRLVPFPLGYPCLPASCSWRTSGDSANSALTR